MEQQSLNDLIRRLEALGENCYEDTIDVSKESIINKFSKMADFCAKVEALMYDILSLFETHVHTERNHDPIRRSIHVLISELSHDILRTTSPIEWKGRITEIINNFMIVTSNHHPAYPRIKITDSDKDEWINAYLSLKNTEIKEAYNRTRFNLFLLKSRIEKNLKDFIRIQSDRWQNFNI